MTRGVAEVMIQRESLLNTMRHKAKGRFVRREEWRVCCCRGPQQYIKRRGSNLRLNIGEQLPNVRIPIRRQKTQIPTEYPLQDGEHVTTRGGTAS